MDATSNPIEPFEDDGDRELGEKMLGERLAGSPYRTIARRHGRSMRDTQRLITAALPTTDEAGMKRTYLEEVARLSALGAAFYQRALNETDPVSAQVYCKLSERLADLLGLNSPRPLTPIMLLTKQPDDGRTSTERLNHLLKNFIRDNPKKPVSIEPNPPTIRPVEDDDDED